MITVRVPEPLREGPADRIVIDAPTASLGDLVTILKARLPNFSDKDELLNFAINGELVLHGEKAFPLHDGDEVDIVVSFAGG
jgi:molybdopterin converting factor small subunit